ncbi:MAG: peroxiredoxin family protein [Acidimicrobiales bacterium]|nr:peroxiredoxin family protein [Acidimicrobiales bacterium]|tara:strand:- start:4462 stop:5319 length:858 start_codon:yes stop_codon:yes gene_type:complete
MPDFEAAGAKLYVLSYDEADALADFKKAHGTTFTMLSDPDSEVIRSFGILNATIADDDHPWYGIPYPGVYITDSDGIIVEKFFENNFTVRPGPEQLLAAVRGEEVLLEERPNPVSEVSVDVDFVGDSLPVGISRQIVARFSLPEGMHVYGQPVPEGLVAASIELDEQVEGLVAYTPITPATRSMTLTGDGHTLEVYEGDVVLRLPVAQNGRAMTKDEEGRWVSIAGRVRWQACDSEACGLPEEQTFNFRVPAAFTVMADMGPGEGRVPSMNGATHFQKMTSRRHA